MPCRSTGADQPDSRSSNRRTSKHVEIGSVLFCEYLDFGVVDGMAVRSGGEDAEDEQLHGESLSPIARAGKELQTANLRRLAQPTFDFARWQC